jgi:tetratricopeptide (TPR) repeat protein/nucleoside phosphorylase
MPGSVDVLVLTAVKDEYDVVLASEPDWNQHIDPSGFVYCIRTDPAGLRWAFARAVDMGPENAANLATRLVSVLKPTCLAMVGVCAGWRPKVQLGDVIVAERLFRYDAGKLRAFRDGNARQEEVFHDIRTFNLDSRWRQRAEDFSSEWASEITQPRPLEYPSQEAWLLYALDDYESDLAGRPREHDERKARCQDWTEVVTRLEQKRLVSLESGLHLTDSGRHHVQSLRDLHPDGFPPGRTRSKAHVAPMATGSKVVEDEEIFPTIHGYARKTLGIDMEGSAIAAVAEIERVPQSLVVKGIQDHADRDKDDRFRGYAIEAAYRFVSAFLRVQLSGPKRSAHFVVPQTDTVSFTGREDELEALKRTLLGSGTERVCSIVGLSGTGGVGKSALAVHFAMLNRHRFPDGVIGVRVDGKDVATIARDFARNAGVPIEPEDERDASAIMQSVFAARDALLIFDNAEDASIRKLLPGGNCAVIVTTRDRGLPASLEVPETGRIDVPVLPDPRCLELLRKRLGQRVDAEPEAANLIVRLVGGLPLAIQIMAARLEVESWRRLGEMVEALRSERDRLTALAFRGDQDLDVRVSFSASLKMLEPEEIDFFACLGVCHPDSFSVGAATAATNSTNPGLASDRLGYLYRLSLVNRPESIGDDRFVLHPLLRVFASELGGNRNLNERAEERHAQYLIALIKGIEDGTSLTADDVGEALMAGEWLLRKRESDYAYLISLEPLLHRHGYWKEAESLMARFLELARERAEPEAVVQLGIQRSKFLQLSGDLQGSLEVLHSVLPDVETTANRRTEAMVLNSLGGVLQRLGRFEEAADALQRSHELVVAQGDERGQAMVLNSLGGVLQRLGRFEEAVDALQRSHELSQGDERGQAMALNSLGGVLQRLGRFEEAADTLQRSKRISEETGDQRSLAMALNSLGGVLQRLGRFDEAADALQRSKRISEEMGDQRSLAMVLNSLGGVLQRLGRFDEAADALQRSHELLVAQGDERGQAMVLNSLGGVLQRLGQFEEAADALQRSYELFQGDERSQAMALNSLGGVLQRLGRLEEAADALQRSHEMPVAQGDERGQAMVLNSLGGVLQRLGRFEEAADALNKAGAIEERLKNERGQAMVLNSLAGVLQRLGRYEEAVGALAKAEAIEERLKDERGQAMVLNSLGGVLQRLGRYEEAVGALAKAEAIEERQRNERGQAMVLNSLGGVLQRLGRFEEAADALNKAGAIEEHLKNRRGQAIVLTSLGGLMQRLGRFEEAAAALQRSHELFQGDERSQALVLSSLGGVLQRLGRIQESDNAFASGITLGEKSGDRLLLAKVHTSYGKALVSRRDLSSAVEQLRQGFHLDEEARDKRGIAIVTPVLVGTLRRLGAEREASEIIQRAFAIAPDSRAIELLNTPKEGDDTIDSAVELSISGRIKRILVPLGRMRYGFLTRDDDGSDAYFSEQTIGESLFSRLAPGMPVQASVVRRARGWEANSLTLLDAAGHTTSS